MQCFTVRLMHAKANSVCSQKSFVSYCCIH